MRKFLFLQFFLQISNLSPIFNLEYLTPFLIREIQGVNSFFVFLIITFNNATDFFKIKVCLERKEKFKSCGIKFLCRGIFKFVSEINYSLEISWGIFHFGILLIS